MSSDSPPDSARRHYTFATALLCALALLLPIVLASCDVFDVSNPGTIRDEDLNTPQAVSAIVSGMSGSLSNVLDDIGFAAARMSDEMAASGSYFLTGRVRYGIFDPEEADTYWEGLQEARYTAENGIERLQGLEGYEFEGNPQTARAYLLAGMANRVLAETFCRVVFDGGEAQDPSAAFERAVGYFTSAIEQAEAAEAEDIRLAALGGRAQAYAGLEAWENAAADAAEVPVDFVYEASYSSNSSFEYNEIFDETHQRYEMSAYGSLAGGHPSLEPLVGDTVGVVPPEERDPRAPYTDCRTEPGCTATVGADGQTPHLRQEKYQELGADIPLVKGTEMRLIQAEAALVRGNLSETVSFINEARAFYDLAAASATRVGEKGPEGFAEGTGWGLLDRERHLTLWLEARRLNDLRRWDHPYLHGGAVKYRQQVERRAACIPISESECNTNPNVECQLPYVE